VLVGPKMKQRLICGAADFPRKAREGADASSILAHFDRGGGGKFAQAGFQLNRKLHAGDYI
jgi:hypothetical protein